MTKQYFQKEDIDKVVLLLKKFNISDFEFSEWFKIRLLERGLRKDFVLKTFSEFERIHLIEEDILKFGDIGYDLHYELDDKNTLIIGVVPKTKLTFIHAILRYRNWKSALKH